LDIFLDSNILFDAVEITRTQTLLNRVINSGNKLMTSITVMGEVLAVCISEQRRDEMEKILDICSQLGIEYLLPEPLLRSCCFCMDELDPTNRVSSTDRTHLAYAKVGECDYFLTTDEDLQHFSLAPCDLGKKRIITPDELRSIL
jgi:predicted nucleic acid-binding protein